MQNPYILSLALPFACRVPGKLVRSRAAAPSSGALLQTHQHKLCCICWSGLTESRQFFAQKTAKTMHVSFQDQSVTHVQQTSSPSCEKWAFRPFCSFGQILTAVFYYNGFTSNFCSSVSNIIYWGHRHTSSLLPWKWELSFLD